MDTQNRQIFIPRSFALRDTAVSVGRFLWHFLQMAIAMELGMIVYHKLLYPVLAPTGFGALTDAYPLFGYWMMLIAMALGMIVLMRFHKSSWRYCMEMTGAMFTPLVALTALVLFALCPAHILYAFGDPLMFLAMAVFMIVRPAKHAHGGNEQDCH